jgi:putative membrane protein
MHDVLLAYLHFFTLLAGFARVFFGLKPALYYWHNPYFHALWVTYLLIGLLSVIPTFSFIRWAKAERTEPGFAPPPNKVRHVRGHLILEILLFCIAPLFAVLMARGYGM